MRVVFTSILPEKRICRALFKSGTSFFKSYFTENAQSMNQSDVE